LAIFIYKPISRGGTPPLPPPPPPWGGDGKRGISYTSYRYDPIIVSFYLRVKQIEINF